MNVSSKATICLIEPVNHQNRGVNIKKRAQKKLGMSRIFLILIIIFLGSSYSLGAPIKIGDKIFQWGIDAFPSSVIQLAGKIPDPFGGISATEGLTGADIDTGAFNLNASQVFELFFPIPIVNQPGDDIYFTDGRFSADALSFNLGEKWDRIATQDFRDTGVESSIRNRKDKHFDLFAATIDMSDFGFAPGESITSFLIRGVSESDPIVIGNLNAVPIPPTILLLATGLIGLGALQRKLWRG
jgi:hypothetical protein